MSGEKVQRGWQRVTEPVMLSRSGCMPTLSPSLSLSLSAAITTPQTQYVVTPSLFFKFRS